MRVSAALKSYVPYPLAEEQLEVVSQLRGLNLNDEFNGAIGKSRSFELTYADCIKMVVLHPNVSEGGVSISIGDRKALLAIANGIYRKYDEPLIAEERPAVYPIND